MGICFSSTKVVSGYNCKRNNGKRNSTTVTETLTSQSLQAAPLPTLPFDLIEEILCRLPVKFLLQLRCLCKSFNSLISNPKFAKKHLRFSTTRHLHCVSYTDFPCKLMILKSCPVDPVFTNITTDYTQSEYPMNMLYLNFVVGSCNGILCITDNYKDSVILCNPSIRKFKELPLFEKPKVIGNVNLSFGFGYDSLEDKYKVVVVLQDSIRDSSRNYVNRTEVKVLTLGTNFWKSIHEFPFGVVPVNRSGKFVSGTINWLASTNFCGQSPPIIVSFNLGKESYQEVLPPDLEGLNAHILTLDVLRDCLCILVSRDIWIMKEYRNKESWTKLFTVSSMQHPIKDYAHTKVLDVFEDDQVLLQSVWGFERNLVVYDSMNDTFKYTNFKSISEVCVESLISPCS